MPLEPDFCIIYTAECTLHKFQDKTNWGEEIPGSGTPPLTEEPRDNGAHVLICAYVEQSGKENFIPVDSVPYLTKLEFDINNTKDGHYMYEVLRFPIYNVLSNYIAEALDVNGEIAIYASLIYYPVTDKFYKALTPSLGIPPDDVAGLVYWEEILDFTVDSIRESDQIIIYRWDDIYTCRYRKCVRQELIALGCGCEDITRYLKYFKKKTLLDGAYALSDNQEYNKAEGNIRLLETMCPKC
jgi:hypothetical protein